MPYSKPVIPSVTPKSPAVPQRVSSLKSQGGQKESEKAPYSNYLTQIVNQPLREDVSLKLGQQNILTLNIQTAKYGKCPKILYTNISDRMAYANNVDPDQTVPRVYTVCHSTKCSKKQLLKKQN